MSRQRRNIELKARIADLERARESAREIAPARVGIEQQVDTYFGCRTGRLKLRERDELPSQLIAYERTNLAESKPSDYRLVEVAEPDKVKAALSMALGVEAVVAKVREILMYENVRIHLDEVEGQGAFIEFEAVLCDGDDESDQYAKVEMLCQHFGIAAEDYVEGSYGAENAE